MMLFGWLSRCQGKGWGGGVEGKVGQKGKEGGKTLACLPFLFS